MREITIHDKFSPLECRFSYVIPRFLVFDAGFLSEVVLVLSRVRTCVFMETAS